jgi:hypothetical protein
VKILSKPAMKAGLYKLQSRSNSESLFLSDWIGGRFDEGAINIHYILICLLNLATARGQIVSTAALAPQNSNRIYYRSGPVA